MTTNKLEHPSYAGVGGQPAPDAVRSLDDGLQHPEAKDRGASGLNPVLQHQPSEYRQSLYDIAMGLWDAEGEL